MAAMYYDILGVSRTATQKEIRRAYVAIMKQHHPDTHGWQNDPIARVAAEAYQVLCDSGKRRAYDQVLNGNGESHSPYYDQTTFGNGEIRVESVACTSCGKVQQDFFPELFGPSPFPLLERCTRCHGTRFEIPMKARERCEECDGYGYNRRYGPHCRCRDCSGNGWVPARVFTGS
jgi:molecular chaperone DnaJ